MKLALCLSVVFFASCASVPATPIQETSTNVKSNRVAISLGMRALDEEDWEPVEDQLAIGAEFSNERPESAVGFEIGLLASSEEDDSLGLDVEGSTGEIYGGIRKSFGSGVVRPYVGAGLSFINTEFEVSGLGSDDDSSIAGYVHGGVLFDISESFFLGVDGRLLLGSDIEMFGVEGNADYSQFALVFGFSL